MRCFRADNMSSLERRHSWAQGQGQVAGTGTIALAMGTSGLACLQSEDRAALALERNLMSLAPPRPLVLPVPAANELVQLWYAVQAARRLNATRRQMLLDMWRRVAGFENTEGALLLRLG
ncbi:unnamed protein product, partial [Symbiodinium microadriaticum]